MTYTVAGECIALLENRCIRKVRETRGFTSCRCLTQAVAEGQDSKDCAGFHGGRV